MRPHILLALLFLALPGCTPTEANRGNLLDPAKVAEIKAGQSTRDNVLGILGTPSARSSFNDNTWYYIGQRTEQYSFLNPDVTDQQVVTVKFNDEGVVQNIGTTGKDAIADIAPAGGETTTYGRETTWIQDLFGNIGRAGVPINRQR